VASKKTWIWIVVAVLGLCTMALFAVAGLGIYFVTSHISTDRTSSTDAFRRFDQIRSKFEEQRPLFELDHDQEPRMTRKLSDLPDARERPTELMILAWDPDDERLSSITLPFWMLRFGNRNLEIQNDGGFDLNALDLDVAQLERVGPLLVFDFRTPEGERVLVWTQ
jgi:hypothetical protein